MSIPRDLLDQLLSGYLDDSLSDDERKRVEQLLESDPGVADELAQLQSLRQSLKAVAQADSQRKLDVGFADRVLGAAVAQARAEGLGDDHPLIRLSEQPSISRKAESADSNWKVAGLLVGLAASIVFAVIALRPSPRDDNQLAQVEQSTQQAPKSAEELPEVLTETPEAIEPQMVAQVDVHESPEALMAVDPPTPESVTSQIPLQGNTAQRNTATANQRNTAPGSIDSIVQSESNQKRSDVLSPTVSIDTPMSQLGMVIVLDVRRTEAGRENGVVENAMEESSIGAASEMQITDEVAGYVNAKVEPNVESDDVTVLYLNVSGKAFDQFYKRLWHDQEGIDSVRMSYVVDAPLLKVVKALETEPTAVRHEGAAFELMSDSGMVNRFAYELSQLDFSPEGDRSKTPQTAAVPTGPDVPAQVLILVR